MRPRNVFPTIQHSNNPSPHFCRRTPGIDQTGGVVELDFDKSISDGVNLYAKRAGDADFVFLPATPPRPT